MTKNNNVPSEEDVITLYNRLKGQKTADFIVQAKAMADSLVVMSKIAQVTTESEFVDAIIKSEFPAIKLSPQEMEIVRGGAWWSFWTIGTYGMIVNRSGGDGPGYV